MQFCYIRHCRRLISVDYLFDILMFCFVSIYTLEKYSDCKVVTFQMHL